MTELQSELWRQMLAVRSEGWNRFVELMRSPDERIALRATTWFLDRMLSRPAILSDRAHGDEDDEPDIPLRLDRFLGEPKAVERGDEDDVA